MDELIPTIIVLHGATGDLAKRMVLPAIYDLFQRGLLPPDFALVGNGRGDVSHGQFRSRVKKSLNDFAPAAELSRFDDFAGRTFFAGGGFTKDDAGTLPNVIREARSAMHKRADAGLQIVHYMALPPSAFAQTTTAIGTHDLGGSNVKAVYEKPYGTSTANFRALDETVHGVFAEDHLFRIDHFLGKEATQNLHLTRFANRPFADVWSNKSVAQVQIDVPETLDIADRAAFYDQTGAALDMLVTHLFQVAAEVAMEPPASFDGGDLQAAREKVLAAFRPLNPAEVVLGQYAGYRQTDGVANDSITDTFVAVRLWVDNDRWQGVPFLLRTGKKMATSYQRVGLIFRPSQDLAVPSPAGRTVLAFDLSGNGAIDLGLAVKKPGLKLEPAETGVVLNLENVAPGAMPPYTSLIYDVLAGDRSLFVSSSGLASAFRAFQPLLDAAPKVFPYADDSWGPAAADELPGELGWRFSHGEPLTAD